MPGIEPIQFEIGGVPFAVSHHHHRNLIFTGSTRSPYAATFARRSWQSALPLERFQEEGLVRLNDAIFMPITMPGYGSKKAVSLKESGVLVAQLRQQMTEGLRFQDQVPQQAPAYGLAFQHVIAT